MCVRYILYIWYIFCLSFVCSWHINAPAREWDANVKRTVNPFAIVDAHDGCVDMLAYEKII